MAARGLDEKPGIHPVLPLPFSGIVGHCTGERGRGEAGKPVRKADRLWSILTRVALFSHREPLGGRKLRKE